MDDDALIRSLIGRAAHIADEGTPEEYRTLFTDDATWSWDGVTQTGLDEIVDGARTRRANGISGPGTDTRHLVVPLHVAVDGDTAHAVSYFLFFGDTATVPTVRVFGVYEDDVARTPEGWRLRSRLGRRA